MSNTQGMSKEDCYNEATRIELGNNPQGTRMDVIYRAMELYAAQQQKPSGLTPPLFVRDTIEGEFIEVGSLEEARKYVIENFTEGNTMHPDFFSFDVFKKVGDVYVIEDNGKAVKIDCRTTDSPSPSPAQEAVEFAEWISNNQFTYDGYTWKSTKIHYSPEHYITAALYQLFLTNKNK